MKNNFRTLYAMALVVGDFIALLAAFVIAYIVRVTYDARPLIEQVKPMTYLKIFLIVLPFWILIFAVLGLYKRENYEKRLREFLRLLVGTFVGILVVIGYDFISTEPVFPARLVPVYALALGFSLLVLERQILWHLKKLLYRFDVGVERVVLIGSSRTTRDLAQLLGDTRTSGYKIVAIVGNQQAVPDNFKGTHFSHLSEGLEGLQKMYVDTIIQTKVFEQADRNLAIRRAALARHIDYKLILAEDDLYGGRTQVELFHYFPIISVDHTPLLEWGRVVKRTLDLLATVPALILLSPFLLLIALIIKLSDGGPVFFRHRRLTRFGAKVDVIKFRSMRQGMNGDYQEVFTKLDRPDLIKEYEANRGKVADDPRVSRIGKFLRKTSLDELPQLFNVLSGQLSLVGPRAIPAAEMAAFKDDSPLLLTVKTGLTGLAQVSGRSDLSMEERVRLDLYYVQNWSLWLDVKIIFKTFLILLSNRGAR